MDFRVASLQGFLIDHCPTCRVPGYLVITPAARIPSLAELPPGDRRGLGQVLGWAAEAIRLTIAPVRLHCLPFAEAGGPPRVHLFPRTRQVTHGFLGAFPGRQDLLRRPLVMHWARAHYRAPAHEVWELAGPLIPALREALLLVAGAQAPLP
jgi:diadenosine tetraphosphate (Ap4A) HIT family hydrolase